jgi:hypothetical protein
MFLLQSFDFDIYVCITIFRLWYLRLYYNLSTLISTFLLQSFDFDIYVFITIFRLWYLRFYYNLSTLISMFLLQSFDLISTFLLQSFDFDIYVFITIFRLWYLRVYYNLSTLISTCLLQSFDFDIYVFITIFRLWYLCFYYNLSRENNIDTSSEFIYIYLGHVYACLTPLLFDLNDWYCQYRGRMVVTRAVSAYHHWLTLWVRIPLRWGIHDTTLCNKVCQGLAKGRWFSQGSLVSSTNKTDFHDIAEILLKAALNTINHQPDTENDRDVKYNMMFLMDI